MRKNPVAITEKNKTLYSQIQTQQVFKATDLILDKNSNVEIYKIRYEVYGTDIIDIVEKIYINNKNTEFIVFENITFEDVDDIQKVIEYLNETQMTSLEHINTITIYNLSKYMSLDINARRNLEITEKMRDKSKKGTLLWVLDKTSTSMGGRNLRRWINNPLIDECEINSRLDFLINVGLDYLTLSRSAGTLSGGEAQRVKLATELSKRATGRTLYILDEPTTGLHSYDVDKLCKVLNRLQQSGNTVIIIEHNLDVLKSVDYLFDMGPEGGKKGGRIVAEGTPEQLADNPDSVTGPFLKEIL